MSRPAFISYPELGAEFLVRHQIAGFQGSSALVKRLAILVAERLGHLGGIHERLNEWITVLAQVLDVTLRRLELPRRKCVYQLMQSLSGLGVHGPFSPGSVR